MAYQDRAHLNPDAVVYRTPCGRWSVERAGASRFVVYGPNGRPLSEPPHEDRRDAEERACIMAVYEAKAS